ncbi:MAG: NAD(P)H-binding protein [Bacteroidota bacterium]
MSKTAIIIGATGLTGGILTQQLLEDNRYKSVKLISRRTLGLEHPKLEEHLIDMQQLKAHKDIFKSDELFCCIGTTKAKTPNESAYRKVDYDIPVNAARICKENGISTFGVMSSLGADSKSRIFYSRLKGEMERAVIDLGIDKTIIVRPSLIAGKRTEKRLGEGIGKLVMKLLNPIMLGSLKVYRAIHPESIAKAMIWLANNPVEKTIFLSDELQKISEYGD